VQRNFWKWLSITLLSQSLQCREVFVEALSSKTCVFNISLPLSLSLCLYLSNCIHVCSLSSKKDYTVLECVVGFAVVPHPVTGALISTSHSTGNTIILERLTKEMVLTSDGPVNLLETLPFKFLFQKTLTSRVSLLFCSPHLLFLQHPHGVSCSTRQCSLFKLSSMKKRKLDRLMPLLSLMTLLPSAFLIMRFVLSSLQCSERDHRS
jgi:hypothetical protein